LSCHSNLLRLRADKLRQHHQPCKHQAVPASSSLIRHSDFVIF